jgi:DNA-binding ferritin-like protein
MSFDSKLIKSIQKFLLIVKFHHWNTKSYNTHKVTDQMFADFQIFLDKFTEVYMGYTGEKFISGSKMDFNIVIHASDKAFISDVQKFRKFLYGVETNADLSGDLINILQEMQSSVNQYLLLLSYQ